MAILIPKRLLRDVDAEYRAFADSKYPLHALSGRFDRIDRTSIMNDAILSRMTFAPGQRVLDIGCGDASLLCALPGVTGVGTVLTTAELARLQGAPQLKHFQFYAAALNELDVIPGQFDRIVINGAIHFTRTPVAARRALRQAVGLLRPGGQLWLGELLAKDYFRREFSSKREALRHLRQTHGTRFALTFLRHIVRHWRRADRIIELPPKLWHLPQDDLPELAESLGLKVLGVWKCVDLTGDAFYELQDRYSVLFALPDSSSHDAGREAPAS